MEDNTWSPITSTPPPIMNETSPETKNSPKPNKIAIVLTALFAVIATAVAIVFAVLYFNAKPTNCIADNSAESAVDSEQQSNNNANDEESEVTDPYIIRDLDEKIAFLHDRTINSMGTKAFIGGYPEVLNVYNNTLKDEAKVAHLIRNAFAESDYRWVDLDEREAVIKDLGYTGEAAEIVRNNLNTGIDGSLVASKYLDVFGTELNRQTSDGCYYYQYNAEHDLYYQNPYGGCGGTSPFYRYYYKLKTTQSGNNAYVYVAAALASADTGNIYCEVAESAVCDTVEGLTNFSINATNYDKYQMYRFVFEKSNDGTYHFVEVEKV